MYHHSPPAVLPVELPPQGAHKDHRKFQPLALVDTHDPHGIVIFTDQLRGPEIHLVFLEMLDIAHKMKQAFIAGLLIGHRLIHQLFQIRTASRPGRHGSDIIQISGLLQNKLQKSVDWRIRHLLPGPVIEGEEFFHLFLPAVGPGPVEKDMGEAPLLPAADFSQFPVRKTEHRGVEHRGQGDIPVGIVQNFQKTQYRLHLRGGKITGTALHESRNPVFPQHLHKGLSAAAGAAHQNHNIGKPYRPQLAAGLVCDHLISFHI